MKVHPIVRAVAALRFENCFNPYTDRCAIHDRSNAPQYRAAALSTIVSNATQEPIDAIWLGRDLGYRGGRRTGLALTDDVHIARHAQRWDCVVERPTIGTAIAERTAAVIWSMLDQIEARIFLWNVFPLHPHDVDAPFSNRQHNAKERQAGEALLEAILGLLKPSHILAIGNDAASVASKVANNIPVIPVRHPSYGGQSTFQRQVTAIYRVKPPMGLLTSTDKTNDSRQS